MSEAYQFAIGRSRALVLAGCFVAAAMLLFFAGAITGTLYTTSRQSSAQAVVALPSVKAPELPKIQAPEPAAGSSAPAAAQSPSPADVPGSGSATNTPAPEESPTPVSATTIAPAPAAAASATPEDSARQSSAAAPASTNPSAAPTEAAASAEAKPQPAAKPVPAKAPTLTPVTATSYSIPLAVRVGSFSLKSNAETLMQSLKDKGYQPAMTQFTDTRGRLWYVVKLGPYTKWNTASLIATRISIAENVTPVIGPMQ